MLHARRDLPVVPADVPPAQRLRVMHRAPGMVPKLGSAIARHSPFDERVDQIASRRQSYMSVSIHMRVVWWTRLAMGLRAHDLFARQILAQGHLDGSFPVAKQVVGRGQLRRDVMPGEWGVSGAGNATARVGVAVQIGTAEGLFGKMVPRWS